MINYVTFFNTIMKSKKIRNFLDKNGFESTVKKFPVYGKRNILGPDQIHQIIYEGLVGNKPFMVGRFGWIEILVAGTQEHHINYHKDLYLKTFCNNAGFFPENASLLEDFSKIMITSSSLTDVQGISYIPYEDIFMLKHFSKECSFTEIRYLEPWFSNKPWTRALKGKKVLVIHPFYLTIQEQYSKREQLFKNSDILPDFYLETMPAVQTIAGTHDNRFSNWFEALDYMFVSAMEHDFDIALIGCGAYGYPLAAKLKEAGKKAVHLGGVLQALFGIKGQRWEIDRNPVIRNMYNSAWVRPKQSETPTKKDFVESGCYW